MILRACLAACLLLAACGSAPNPAAPLVAEGPMTDVPFPDILVSLPPAPRQAAVVPPPSAADAIVEVAAGPGCTAGTHRTICASPAALWLDTQLDGIRGWKIGAAGSGPAGRDGLPAIKGQASTDSMRQAARRWIDQCGTDVACIEDRQFRMLRTLTAAIDLDDWGGRYEGQHWSMMVVPSQYAGEVNVFLTLAHNGRTCALAFKDVRLDLQDQFPLPDIRDRAISGRDRLVLADPGNPSALIRFTRVGRKVWVHREGDTVALDQQCRAGAIYGEYRKVDGKQPVVSYLGAPGLEPLPPHIMVPG